MSKVLNFFGILALVALIVFLVVSALVRFDIVGFDAVGMVVLIVIPVMAVLGLLAVLGGLVNLVSKNGGLMAIVFGLLAIGAAAPNLMLVMQAKDAPMLHDITTDLVYPPEFVDTADARLEKGIEEWSPYETEEQKKEREEIYAKAEEDGVELERVPNAWLHNNDEKHAEYYSDLKTQLYAAEFDAVYDAAVEAVEEMGMEITGQNKDAGRIEAVATSTWWGFKDDVVIRVNRFTSPIEVDMRSRSRQGESDLGANAKRIRAFYVALDSKV